MSMLAHTKTSVAPAVVITDPAVMCGMPVVRGTRVPAQTIVEYLRDGYTAEDIFMDYPSLPLDGIEAVIRWADSVLGSDWRKTTTSAS